MNDSRIDIPGSPWRTAALLAGSCLFVAACAALLYFRPRGVEPGSLGELGAIAGIPFFGLCGAVAARWLFRTGPVVSVGPEGVFDRRLTTDWIPWDAIHAVGVWTMNRQKMLVLQIDPDRDAALPLKSGARRMAKLNAGFGMRGYWIGANDLEGGFPALDAAVSRFQPH